MSRTRARTIETERPKPSFGSIEIRGHSCRAVYRINGDKQTKTFDTYTEAYDFLEEQGQTIRRGGAPRNLLKARTPWSTVAWAWYEERHPGDPIEERGREYYALKKFEETFGSMPIGDITRAMVQTWINGLEMAPKTIHDYYGVLGQIMRIAQLDGYLPNGCPVGKGLHKLPPSESRKTFLTEEQTEHLLRVCLRLYPAHYALVHLTAHTGLRQGEALGLLRDRYSAVGEYLMIEKSARKRTRDLGSTKTRRARRVDLFPCCVEVLNAHLAGHEHDLVFPDRGGRIMSADNWRNRVWTPLVEESGFQNLHFHDLRHTHCSLLLEQGWDVGVVAERLGHASTKMTLDVYGHVRETRQAELIKKRHLRAV
jgi:integrase